jgi:hypothetical protein
VLNRLLALCAAAALTCWGAAGPLRIIHVGVRQIEDGPAVGDRVKFVPGETVYVSFDVENYTRTKDESVSISWIVDAADPKGVPIVPPAPGKKQANLTPEDKDWLPRIRQSIAVPSPAPGGDYSVHIQITDENSKQTAVADTKFTVSGAEFIPVKALELRSFGFYRTEDEPQPLMTATYSSGDTMFARFQIVGYKYGPQNAIEVTYGISIVSPEGKVLYTQDPAVEEKSAAFYPRPYIDSNMNLSLKPGTKAGEYTLVITAHDKIGHQDVEIRKVFRVE